MLLTWLLYLPCGVDSVVICRDQGEGGWGRWNENKGPLQYLLRRRGAQVMSLRAAEVPGREPRAALNVSSSGDWRAHLPFLRPVGSGGGLRRLFGEWDFSRVHKVQRTACSARGSHSSLTHVVLCCGKKTFSESLRCSFSKWPQPAGLFFSKFSSTLSYDFCLLPLFSSMLSVVLSHRCLHASLCPPYTLDFVNSWNSLTSELKP